MDRLEVKRGIPGRALSRLALGGESRQIPSAGARKGRDVHRRGRRDLRRRLEPDDDVIEEAQVTIALFVLAIGHRQIDEHQPVGGEAHVHALQPQDRLRQQAGGCDYRHGERDLGDDQRTSAAPHPGRRRRPTAALQRRDQIGAGREERRRQPCTCRGDERDRQCEEDNARVDAHGVHAGKPVGNEDNQRVLCPCRGAETDHRSGQGQEHAFCEELLHQPAATGAKRGTNRQLLPSTLAAEQQQVRHVGARNQQHQADRAEEDQHRRAHVADHHVCVPAHDRRHAGHCVCGWRGRHSCGERTQLAGCLLNRGAWPQPSNQIDVTSRRPPERRVRRD